MNRLKALLLEWLSAIPEAEQFVSQDTLRYWLRKERQAILDGKGKVE